MSAANVKQATKIAELTEAWKTALTERDNLRAALEQVKAVCEDNRPRSCDKGAALDFVRQVATGILEQRVTEGKK